MSHYYILDSKNNVIETSKKEWMNYMFNHKKFKIEDEINDILIKTSFIGVNYDIFEICLFDSNDIMNNIRVATYSNIDEAYGGHFKFYYEIESGNSIDYYIEKLNI